MIQSWKIIRSVDYDYLGTISWFGDVKLVFKHHKYADEYMLVDRAKYIHVESNTVDYLIADRPTLALHG